MKRRIKSPLGILLFLLIPIVMTAIIGMIFSPRAGNAQLPPIKIILVDNDKSLGSKFFTGAFDTKEIKDLFQVTMAEENEGKRLISKGKASALIIIPAKFTDDLSNQKKTTIHLIKNPSEEFLPGIVEEFVNTMGIVISGFVQVFEPEIKIMKKFTDMDLENLSIPEATPFLEAMKTKFLSLKKFTSPMLIELKKETSATDKKKKEPEFNLFALIMPGMLVMFLLFVVEGIMREILADKENGILQRMMFSPLRIMDFIISRIFSGFVVGVLMFWIAVVIGALLFEIKWGNYWYLFILIALTSFWAASFFALLNAFFKNRNQAAAFSAPIILVFSAFGGSMLPLEQIPAQMRWVSTITLNHWFITGAIKIGSNEFPIVPLLVLFILGVILFILAVISLNRRIKI